MFTHHRRRLARILPALLATIGLPVLAALVSGIVPLPARAPDLPALTAAGREATPLATCPEGGASAPPGRSPGVAGAATGGAATGSPGTDGGAWRFQPLLARDGTLSGWRLIAMSPGSRSVVLDLPGEAAVRGPAGGQLVVVSDDGKGSQVRLVSLRDSCARVAATAKEVIREAVLEPGSGALLVHEVRRSDRSDLGTWRLPDGSAEPAQLLLSPVTNIDPIATAIGPAWSTDLVLSHDGQLLAVQTCGEQDCRTRVVELADQGIVATFGDEQGSLVGLDSRHAVAFHSCTGLPCPLVAADLETRREQVLAERATSATTLVVGGRLIAVATVLDQAGPSLVAIDAADGRHWELARPGPSLVLLPAGGGPAGGIEPGPGLVPAMDSADGLPFGLDAGQLASILVGEGDR